MHFRALQVLELPRSSEIPGLLVDLQAPKYLIIQLHPGCPL